jgi:MFS family permease
MAAPTVRARAAAGHLADQIGGRLEGVLGGPARTRVIVTLACVLGLDSADKATVGTSATQLQHALGIGKAQIGLLLAVSSLVGALATVPAGMLTDRINRTRLLAGAVACWGVATLLSGFSNSYAMLLGTRVLLGVVVAAAGPVVASLVGDYFPERQRGRIYGYVLAGELIGAGFGFVIAGQFAVLSWRLPFIVLALPTVAVVWLLVRLPEPARGGASRIAEGADDLHGARDVDERPDAADDPDRVDPDDDNDSDDSDGGGEENLAQRIVRERNITPRESALIPCQPNELSLRKALAHVLAVRTNVVLIVASALGYFFFSGLRGFAVEFATNHYDISHGVASVLTLVLGIGALVGVLAGGRLADRWLRSGHVASRVLVAGYAVLAAGVLFVPALITTHLSLAVPLIVLAAMFLGAANPPLDAARLDIMVPGLWGRAEALRTMLRNGGDAAAPLLFGVLAESVFGRPNGLEYTFLIMLAALFVAAAISLVIGRRTYPHDVAAAAESLRRCHSDSDS